MTDDLTAYLSAFVDELARSGVCNIVISPGSRSTPIALLAAEHPEMQVWMNLDERSAGFFALGMAKASRAPVALLCTSGTAAANYFPAIIESYLARVPLIVLTADRPHELRDVGAPQTIHQIGIYGHHVKWFVEMPIPESTPTMIRHSRMTAARAASTASESPSGPVHLNFPLREPLLPDLQSPALWGGGREIGLSYTTVMEGIQVLGEAALLQLVNELLPIQKGLIICGPHDEPGFADAVTQLAGLLHYPVLADPLSQLRSGSHDLRWVIDGYDAFLRDERVVKQFHPEVIIRFGAMPVSKPLLMYINRYPNCRQIIVDEREGWREPTLLATEMVHAHPGEFCAAMSSSLSERTVLRDSVWSKLWLTMNNVTGKVLEKAGAFSELFEGQLFVELKNILPRNSTLFVGNSMPIRDLDTFFGNNERAIRVLGNRGANGIDGLVSTALGVSAADVPIIQVIGDLSFFHDMNGLHAAKLHNLNIVIIIVNNDGGGIFSFLPQATLPQHFERLFGTPIGLDYRHTVHMYGGSFARVASWEAFREAFHEAVAGGGLQVIEIPTGRESNVTMHREVWKNLSEHLSPLLR